MPRKHLLPAIRSLIIAACFLFGNVTARAEPDPRATKPPPVQEEADGELPPWVRPVQYVSGVVFVAGIILLIYMRRLRSKGQQQSKSDSGGAWPT
jgi:hypothetical protein